jgi:hypothetical protein
MTVAQSLAINRSVGEPTSERPVAAVTKRSVFSLLSPLAVPLLLKPRIMAAMAVAFLDVRRRGRSTIRVAAATAVSLAVAAVLDTTLPGWNRHPPVSLGAAAIAALAVATVLFAARWLGLIQTGIAAFALGLPAAGLTLALAVAGQPFTVLVAGASLGTAVAATVEITARLRCGRWLADPPAGTPVTA